MTTDDWALLQDFQSPDVELSQQIQFYFAGLIAVFRL